MCDHLIISSDANGDNREEYSSAVPLRMNIVGEHQAYHFVHQNLGARQGNLSVLQSSFNPSILGYLPGIYKYKSPKRFNYGVQAK